MPQASRVDLQSCADEPFHLPRSIQPHGAPLVPVLRYPFKRTALNNPRNRTGMGLGLACRRHDGRVVFGRRLPLLAGAA